MRTLNDYFIDGGGRSGIQGAVTSNAVTIPDAGLLVGVAVHISLSSTTATNTFIVNKNGTSGHGVIVTLEGAHASNTGSIALPSGPLNVSPGDRLSLTSGAETTGTPTAGFNYIIRR